MREEYKGFKVVPFLTKEDMFDYTDMVCHEIEQTHQTQMGWIYSHRNRWWDKDGTISGLEYVLEP